MLSTSKLKNIPNWLTDLLSLAIFLGLFYAAWIGSHALLTPDEGRYSEVAREMVTTGDYITPRLNGVVFLDKPILYYWLQASAIHLFGLKEWALRFWPAVIGVLGCLAIYASGRILFNRRTGILSALILATSPLYYGASHYANLDLEVAVLISATLLLSALAVNTDSNKLRGTFFILAYIFAGLAALTKGLIGIAFPILILGTWILLLNRWYLLKKMHLIAGLFIFALITLPWYFLAQKANPEFFHYFFVTQQISRFLTTQDFNNKATMWFYIPIVLGGFFPWSSFIIQSFYFQTKLVWKNRQDYSINLFFLLWFTIIFTFFSIPKSKTIGYILPIFPALAMIVGNYFDHIWQQNKSKGMLAGVIIFILCSMITSIFCLSAQHIQWLEISNEAQPYLLFTATVFAAGSIYAYYFRKNITRIFYGITAIACILLLTLSASASIINPKSVKPLAMLLKEQLQPEDEVITYYKYYQDLPIYLERRITIVADWTASDIPRYDNWVRELWYGMPFQDTKDWLIDESTFWQRWNSDKRVFVLLNTAYFNDFAKKADNRFYQIDKRNDIVLLSNKK